MSLECGCVDDSFQLRERDKTLLVELKEASLSLFMAEVCYDYDVKL